MALLPRNTFHPRSTVFYFLAAWLYFFWHPVITGILLSLYYKPSPDQAFESVRAIMTEINFGGSFARSTSGAPTC